MPRWIPALLLLASPAAAADALTFEKDVRPILKVHCFHCHGEAGEREGKLDLRLRRLLVSGGETGPAIDPGNPDGSLLLQRVRSGEMPPGDDKHLSESEIATIARWVESGALTARPEPEEVGTGPLFTEEERNFWAFQPAIRPAIPIVRNPSGLRTAVDAFLMSRMESVIGSELPPDQMNFSAAADRAALIRRAFFDLLGLPPSPEDVDRFLEDRAPDAWQRLIDRLLASPHYGERWGRHWLDVAGYADSEGYTDEDKVRDDAFRYRDYVVRSFNADKPFDRFVQEQLAGDEMTAPPYANLTPEAIEKLTATGFLRMAPDGTASGGINQTEARNQVIADTLQIVGTALLGLTVNCAQCHDHRYDPIPQADYYRLRAVFEPALDWKNWRSPPARQISLYTDADRELARKIEAQAAEVERQRLAKAEEYITRTLEEELLLVPEGVREPLRKAYRTEANKRSPEQQALLKEYPSVANINIGSLYLYDRRREERAGKLDAERKQKQERYLAETARQELSKVPAEEQAAVQAALQTPADKRTAEQKQLLEKYPGTVVTLATLSQFHPAAAAELEQDRQQAAELRSSKAADDLKRFADQAAEIRARKPEEGFLRALCEVPGKIPVTYVFHRGDPEQPKEAVLPGMLSILPGSAPIPENDPGFPSTGRRLAWSRQLTDGKHPLFARVIVNRIWLNHFGRGLVESPGDFGVLGERPTHPELLDWLAAEFVQSGWSVKHLHRVIMNSSVYRQASTVETALARRDPENRLYSRFPVRRLEAEVIRDAVLAANGKLNDTLYGPPVPVMEDSVGQIVIGQENLDGERKPTDQVSLNGEEYRRSVYVQVRRSRTLSMFETFDAPSLSPNCERRNVSTVAPQSLLLMNSRFSTEESAAFAARLASDAGSDLRRQVILGWQWAYAVVPREQEIAAAMEFVQQEMKLIQEQHTEMKAPDVHQEALSVYCQALISSNRFLYVD